MVVQSISQLYKLHQKQCVWVTYFYLIAHPSDPQVQQIANTLCSWSCLAQSCGMCSKFYLLLVNKYASGFPRLLFVLLWHAWIVCGCWSRVDKIQGIDIPPYTTIFVKHRRNVSTPLHMFLKQIIKEGTEMRVCEGVSETFVVCASQVCSKTSRNRFN